MHFLLEKVDFHCYVSLAEGIHMCQGLNSHYFHIIGDGHQPNSRVYIPSIRIPY